MAKRVKEMRMELMIDPVNSTYSLRRCYFTLDDDAVADVVHTNITGPNPCPQRAITGGELAGTLQAFLDGVKGDIETQEGIGA